MREARQSRSMARWHPKEQGKNCFNLRTNSLQHEENDIDQET
jgi:hypothetical protein